MLFVPQHICATLILIQGGTTMKSKFDIEVGKGLKKIREDARYSQQDIADRLGCSRQRISHYEVANAAISMKDLIKYCDICHVDVNEFIAPMVKLVYKK